MKGLVTGVVVLLAIWWAMAARAEDPRWTPENIVKVCNGGQVCIDQLMQMRASNQAWEQRRLDREAALEMSRNQANGMALFGSGNALINGMNQGFNNMRLPPYQQPGVPR